MDDAVRPALADRHFQRIQHQLGAQMIGHRPAATLRLQASSTTARYRKPLAVGTKVMSATQSWFGRAATKFRSTSQGGSGFLVPPCGRHPGAPAAGADQSGRAHQSGDALAPVLLSSCLERGPLHSAAAPSGSRELAWTVRIASSDCSSCSTRWRVEVQHERRPRH